MAALSMPVRMQLQSEGLPPQLIGRNDNDVHAHTSIAARRDDSISAMIESYVPRRKYCQDGHQRGQFFPDSRQTERGRPDVRYASPQVYWRAVRRRPGETAFFAA